MTAVGIKQLRAKLSSYIDRASKGEKIIVTEHGKEVALLVPVSAEMKAILSLRRENKVKWSCGKPSGIKGVRIKGAPLSETILKERG